MTSPPAPWVSASEKSRAISSANRRRRIVSSGVAMTRRVSDKATPIVLVPTSSPISRMPAGTASRSSTGSFRIMTDDSPFRWRAPQTVTAWRWTRPPWRISPRWRTSGSAKRSWSPWLSELSQILNWVEQLSEIDTADVAPMASVVATTLPMRDDEVTDGGRRDDDPRQCAARGRAGSLPCPR